MKKYRLTRNMGLKIMAFVFAAFLWLIVMNVDDPVDRKTYSNIPVIFANDDIISQEGNVYQVLDEQNVSVVVSAKASVLKDIHSDDIVATADIKEMDTDTGLVPIQVTINNLTAGDDYLSAEAVPRNIQIQVEKTGKKVLSLTVRGNGDPRDGYIVGEMTVNPKQITITGPESIIEQVETAVAWIDTEGISRDSDKTGELRLYDVYGNQVSSNQIYNNLGEDGITVHVEVLQGKTVPVAFDVSGTPAEGYRYVECTSEPASVQIYGKSDVLQDIDAIEVPGDVLNIDGAAENVVQSVDITPYLPEGTMLEEGSTGTLSVTVVIEQEGTRTIDFLVSSIRITNLADDVQVSYQPDAEISLQFRGQQELLDVLDISNAVSVNLKNYTQEGTFSIPVDIDIPDGIEIVGSPTVEITLQKKQDTSEPSGDQGEADENAE